MADNDAPNRKSRMEKAEGDRDTAEANARRGQSESAHGRGDEDAGGITNRPLDEEIENQEAVPDRGHRKSEEQRSGQGIKP